MLKRHEVDLRGHMVSNEESTMDFRQSRKFQPAAAAEPANGFVRAAPLHLHRATALNRD